VPARLCPRSRPSALAKPQSNCACAWPIKPRFPGLGQPGDCGFSPAARAGRRFAPPFGLGCWIAEVTVSSGTTLYRQVGHLPPALRSCPARHPAVPRLHLIHEVTSPQAFGPRGAGWSGAKPGRGRWAHRDPSGRLLPGAAPSLESLAEQCPGHLGEPLRGARHPAFTRIG